jgi:hypothetical protein
MQLKLRVPMLTNRQVAALVHWTGIDPRTITRWYAGFTVRIDSARRIADAVREHDLPRPAFMPQKLHKARSAT